MNTVCKLSVVAIVAGFGFALPAHADFLPADFVGEWCGDGQYYMGGSDCNAGQYLEIRANAYSREEETCYFRSLTATKTKTPRAKTV